MTELARTSGGNPAIEKMNFLSCPALEYPEVKRGEGKDTRSHCCDLFSGGVYSDLLCVCVCARVCTCVCVCVLRELGLIILY